jgi:hypothetical protein
MTFHSPNLARPSSTNASYLDRPPAAGTRRGSGNHHQRHQAPRRGLYHWLSVAVASYEVGKKAEANEAATKLLEMLRQAGILKS